MNNRFAVVLATGLMGLLAGAATLGAESADEPATARWENGPPADPSFFPIGVWLQDPRLASQYKEIGVNLYVGLWHGPTEAQLTALHSAGMPVICYQNDYARVLLQKNAPLLETVVGWMHSDEPDNAQRLPEGGGWGPPVDPAKIVADYQRIRQIDPTRPVYLNLGQGVAWDGWIGRGVRTNKPEDYPEYIKGTDIVSFDIYPAASDRAVKGELWRVGYGVQRLNEWSRPDQPVWSFVECTRIHGAGKATPHQVRAMVWMAIANGATGIQYFVHEWDANNRMVSTSQLLNDQEMKQAVTRINAQIRELAPVLNSPNAADVQVQNSSENSIQTMVKRHGDAVYLFAVETRGNAANGELRLTGLDGRWSAEVIGAERRVELSNGVLRDRFQPWDVHLYRLTRQ
jgi:hypothetical protein